jgi:hypothetical protein
VKKLAQNIKETAEKLKRILQKNPELLINCDELFKRMRAEKIGGGDLAAIQKALSYNIGDTLMVVKRDDAKQKSETEKKVREILQKEHMRAERIDFIIEVFSHALGWDELTTIVDEAAAEDAIMIEEADEEPAKAPPPAASGQKPPAEQFQIVEIMRQAEPPKPKAAEAPLNEVFQKEVPLNTPQPKQETPVQPPPAANSTAPSAPKEASKIKPAYIAVGIILLFVVILFAAGKSDTSDTSSAKPSALPAVTTKTEQPEQKKQKRNVPKATSEVSLGNISIGYGSGQVWDVLGRDYKVEDRPNGLKAHVYEDVNVIYFDDHVIGLESNTPAAETPKGIHQDSTLQDVLNAYGNDYMKSTYDNLTLYEYDFGSLTKYRMRFAINKQNRVDYITIRPLKLPNPENIEGEGISPREAAIQSAMQTLKSFHKNITDHNLRAAYDSCLSDNLKSHMTYDGWAPGFKTTVSSEVSNLHSVSANDYEIVLSYTLTARDNPGGTSRFNSTATMVKTANGWRINDMNNKPF